MRCGAVRSVWAIALQPPRGDGWVMKTIGLAMLERTGTTTGCPRKPEDEEDRLVANRTGRLHSRCRAPAGPPGGGWPKTRTPASGQRGPGSVSFQTR